MTTLYDELKAVLDKLDYSEPTDFDLKTYRENEELINLLEKHSEALTERQSKISRFCNHEHKITRVENYYSTIHCRDCDYLIHSNPPYWLYDRD